MFFDPSGPILSGWMTGFRLAGPHFHDHRLAPRNQELVSMPLSEAGPKPGHSLDLEDEHIYLAKDHYTRDGRVDSLFSL